MDSLVCIKAVEREPPRPRQAPPGFERASATPIINESDDYAVDAAVRLRKLVGGRVTALTVGPLRASDVLYQAMAKGADAALRVDVETDDPAFVARLIAAHCQQSRYDLVITGVESRDELASAVAPALAALLDWPYATSVTALEPAEGGDAIVVDKEMGGGRFQKLALPLPAVVAVQSGVCRLTYAPPGRVLQARRTPPRTADVATLAMTPPGARRLVEVSAPATERPTEMLTGSSAEVAAALMERIERALRG